MIRTERVEAAHRTAVAALHLIVRAEMGARVKPGHDDGSLGGITSSE